MLVLRIAKRVHPLSKWRLHPGTDSRVKAYFFKQFRGVATQYVARGDDQRHAYYRSKQDRVKEGDCYLFFVLLPSMIRFQAVPSGDISNL